MSRVSRFFRASLRSPWLIFILAKRSTKLIIHSSIGGISSSFKFITSRAAIGYLLNLFTSLTQTSFTLLPCFIHTAVSFSLYRKYLTCSTFSTSRQWLSGTLNLGWESSDLPWALATALGRYYLQSCLISGNDFLVIVLICFLRTMAAVRETGFSRLMGISTTSSSFILKKIGLSIRDKILCLGMRARDTIAKRHESRSEGYILMMFGASYTSLLSYFLNHLESRGEIILSYLRAML